MYISLRELEHGVVRFKEVFQPDSLDLIEGVRQSGPLEVEGQAELVRSTDEIRVQGKLAGPMEADCDRCLEPVRWTIGADFRLLYRPATELTAVEDVEIDAEDAEVGFYEGDGLDVKDVVREQIVLSMPARRICREDCLGLCPVCGKNRNQAGCDCQVMRVDNRMAGLANLTLVRKQDS